MNKEQIYVGFRKKVESDDHYFTFGRYGIIEETLAYFGLASKAFRGSHACVHENNLKTLHDFMIKEATDEQLGLIYQVATGKGKIPEINYFGKASGTLSDDDIRYVCVYRIEKSCAI